MKTSDKILIETGTDKSEYSVGEPVRMLITIVNRSPNTLELIFNSAQRYDFIVSKDKEEVWRWSKGKVFAMVLGELRLEPGEGRSYTETWNPGDAEPGEYTVTGMVTSQPPLRADSTFTVVN